MADEGQRQPIPEDFAAQYLAQHPDGIADLSIPEAESEIPEDFTDASGEPAEPEPETQPEPEAPPAPTVPNPLEMTPEERRSWLANASPEEKAMAIATHVNPDEVVLLTSDYSRSKNQLVAERQQFERDRQVFMDLIAQQAQQAMQPPPGMYPQHPEAPPPPPPPDPYADYYGETVQDPRVSTLEQQVQALQVELQRQRAIEGENLLRQDFAKLASEHPWFGEMEQAALRATMQHTGITDAQLVFRNVYYDRLLDEAVVKAKAAPAAAPAPNPEAPVPAAPTVPAVPPSAPSARTKPMPTSIKTMGTPEEFARSVVHTGNVKSAEFGE